MKDDIPIVLIHGWGADEREFDSIKTSLTKRGFRNFYEFTYKENKGELNFHALTRKLANFVSKNVKEKRFNIIGISQGGLIASNYILNFLGDLEVPKCFTICTPHQGSILAYFLNRPGTRDLRPNSVFLNELNHSFNLYSRNFNQTGKTHFYSVYTPFDLMVVPGWSADFKKAAKSKLVLSLLHPLAIKSGQTLKFIEENISS